ncbi:peptidase M35 [Ideonella sp. 4Y11]|uniref:Peptidase M35 n=1 Tax=Ideonella aquatica TaxID=2824119 RepID=A0A940YCB0_9BURK|nr:M35 family metallo-endopeptidase [Ideonella aquatica]MBQ0957545.1 peptidase M35 [Ideonella aquatica]
MRRPLTPAPILSLSTLVACVLASSGAWAAQGLQVELAAPAQVMQGDGEVAVEVVVRNTSARPHKLLRWQLPEGTLHGPLFRVIGADGTEAAYLGPLVKRAAPRAEDLVVLAPGQQLSYRVDLSRQYALPDGRYTVAYLGRARVAGRADLASSAALSLWLSGRSAAAQSVAPEAATSGPITFTGACTAGEQTDLITAVDKATGYASGSKKYLKVMTTPTTRYTTWFGAYTSARHDTVRTHFNKITQAFKKKPLTLDCSCSDPGVYAYVYPNDPYKIYLCGAFWSAPMTGTDSKAGTLIHEMSHFTVVAGTNDWAYGQTAAKALAINNPDRAVDNADSHEYFAENTPAQP